MARNTKKRAVHSLIIYNDLTAVTLLGHGFFLFPIHSRQEGEHKNEAELKSVKRLKMKHFKRIKSS